MLYVILFLCLVNTVFLVGVAASLGKMIANRTARDEASRRSAYQRGQLAMLQTMQRNMERHKDILPAWVLEWVEHLAEAYKKNSDLVDVPTKYQGNVDYSNVLELQKTPSDIKLLKDE